MSILNFAKKPPLYGIEIHTTKIDRDIAGLLYDTSTIVHDFIAALESKDIPGKDVYTRDLIKEFLILKTKTDKLFSDVSSILNIESHNPHYVSVHDDKFLSDKISQLTIMVQKIDNLIEIMRENPPSKEYEEGVLKVFLSNLNSFYRAMDRVRRDDAVLSKIYAQIADM